MKSPVQKPDEIRDTVTPLAGVWVEMLHRYGVDDARLGHSPCGSVG